MTSRRRTLRSEKGQGLVEFALITPLLLILIAGIVGFGIGLNYYLDLTHTANQGARYAAVDMAVCTGLPPNTAAKPCPGTTTFNEFLRNELTSGNLQNGGTQSVPSPGAKVTTCFDSAAKIGEPVTVAISARYRFMPFVRLDVNLVGKATMRMEQVPTKLLAQGVSVCT